MSNEVTPHGAALSLLQYIAWSEGKNLNTGMGNANAPSREWLLWTFAQCLKTSNDPERVTLALSWKIPETPPAQQT